MTSMHHHTLDQDRHPQIVCTDGTHQQIPSFDRDSKSQLLPPYPRRIRQFYSNFIHSAIDMESLCLSGAFSAPSVPGRQLRHSLLQRNLLHLRHRMQRLKAVETELYPIEPLIDDVKYHVC